MSEFLEMLHFPDEHSMPDMNIGSSRIETGLNAQGGSRLLCTFQLLDQFFFPDDVDSTPANDVKLLFNGRIIQSFLQPPFCLQFRNAPTTRGQSPRSKFDALL